MTKQMIKCHIYFTKKNITLNTFAIENDNNIQYGV